MIGLSAQLSAFKTALYDEIAAQQLFGSRAGGASAYANNVLFNRADALVEAFPIVRQLVGEEFFDAMARAAARAQASHSGDLNQYGAEFPAFIARFPPAQSLPYLADAARLDWHCHLAYYADDAEPFEIARLASIGQEEQARLTLVLHPAAAIVDSPWPIASLWQAHQACDSENGADFPSPDQGGESALVYRNGKRCVCVARLGVAEAAFLKASSSGLPLTESLERALDADVEFDLGVSLQRWINDQVIVDYLSGDKT